MRDVDHRDVARAQLVQNPEERLHFGVGKRSRRLVEHEDARFLRQRLSNLNKLLLTNTKFDYRRSRINFQMKLVQQFLCAGVQLFPINDAEASRFSPQKNIFCDV